MSLVNYSNNYNSYAYIEELRHPKNHLEQKRILQIREHLIQSIVEIFQLETNYVWEQPIVNVERRVDIMEQLQTLIPSFWECYELDNRYHLDDPRLWITLLVSCSCDKYTCWIYPECNEITIIHRNFLLSGNQVDYLDYSPKTQYNCLTHKEFDQLERITDPKIVENETCSLCLEDFDPTCLVLGVGKNRMKVVRLPCKHLYHTRCIRNWITTRTSCCPYCTQSCKK